MLYDMNRLMITSGEINWEFSKPVDVCIFSGGRGEQSICDPHSVAGLCKLYFRLVYQLPQAVLLVRKLQFGIFYLRFVVVMSRNFSTGKCDHV